MRLCPNFEDLVWTLLMWLLISGSHQKPLTCHSSIKPELTIANTQHHTRRPFPHRCLSPRFTYAVNLQLVLQNRGLTQEMEEAACLRPQQVGGSATWSFPQIGFWDPLKRALLFGVHLRAPDFCRNSDMGSRTEVRYSMSVHGP